MLTNWNITQDIMELLWQSELWEWEFHAALNPNIAITSIHCIYSSENFCFTPLKFYTFSNIIVKYLQKKIFFLCHNMWLHDAKCFFWFIVHKKEKK